MWVFLVCFGGFGGVEFVHLGFLFIGLSEVGFLGGLIGFCLFFSILLSLQHFEPSCFFGMN